MCGKGPDACLAPRPTKENGMDAAAAANLASKNAVIVCDAAFGRLHFKEGERGDAVLYEPLMLSSKGGAELQVDVADEPKGAKDKKGNTQMRDTCIASAKHDDTRARFLISKYNGYERAKHASTAVMALDVLTYGLSDSHNKPTVQRQFNIELGLVGDEQEFEALGTHGLVLDTSAGLIFSGHPNPQTQAPSTPPDTLTNSPTFNSLFTAPLKADFSQNFDETADRRESQNNHNNNKQSTKHSASCNIYRYINFGAFLLSFRLQGASSRRAATRSPSTRAASARSSARR